MCSAWLTHLTLHMIGVLPVHSVQIARSVVYCITGNIICVGQALKNMSVILFCFVARECVHSCSSIIIVTAI